MATAEEVAQVRALANYTAVDPYDDAQLSVLIDSNSVNRVIAQLWRERAAQQAALVNISESGSTRAMSDAHKNALNMASTFDKLVAAEEAVTDVTRHARTRAIVREGA